VRYNKISSCGKKANKTSFIFFFEAIKKQIIHNYSNYELFNGVLLPIGQINTYPNIIHLIHKNCFSTKSSSAEIEESTNTIDSLENYNNKNIINPWFITGFSDAESSLNVMITKSNSTITGWRVQVRFIIEINSKDEELLKTFRVYFKEIGSITNIPRENIGPIVRWSVVGFNDIADYLIPHFYKYSLQSAKKKLDYELWKKIVEIMKDKKH
jgi:hypothetical protein